jgi:hypothetical protein
MFGIKELKRRIKSLENNVGEGTKDDFSFSLFNKMGEINNKLECLYERIKKLEKHLGVEYVKVFEEKKYQKISKGKKGK